MVNARVAVVQENAVVDSRRARQANPGIRAAVFRLIADRLAFGVAILDEDMRVLYLNPAAARLLPQSDCLALGQDEGLTATISQVNKKLKELVSGVCATGRSAVVAVPVCSGSPLTLFISHGGLMTDDADSGRFLAILYMFTSLGMYADMQMVLADTYRLTPAETRITLKLAQGLTLGAVAEELRISIGTARMHLKHVFKKVGVHSQADLVRNIVMGPVACLLSDSQVVTPLSHHAS